METLDMFRLDNKVAIVTGGAGRYGKHISTALCEAGATVIIASRNADACSRLAAELSARGHQAQGLQLDLSDEKSIRSFVDRVVKRYEKIDILVNNSVTRPENTTLSEATKEGWEKAETVNGTGLMLITQNVVKQMVEQREGNIINISSIQGAVGPHFPVYEGTDMTSGVEYTYNKWGMVGLTKWIANYYGKYNIRCNAISPGGYNPKETPASFQERYKRLTPLGRFADDDDIKGPVVFLASAASKYVTGENLMVDGGWTSW